jgi:hypothetical protein
VNRFAAGENCAPYVEPLGPRVTICPRQGPPSEDRADQRYRQRYDGSESPGTGADSTSGRDMYPAEDDADQRENQRNDGPASPGTRQHTDDHTDETNRQTHE